MSVLNGSISSSVIFPEETPFGQALSLEYRIPLPGCADVALNKEGTLAYAACRDMLVVYSLPETGEPVELGRIYGMRVSRQVAVSEEGIAFVTARPDGLFVIDVRDPKNMKLLCHLDTLELATGICAANGLCLVANRHMGVEIWDVRDPAHPEFCSSFYAGEAQSVCVDGNYAYVGDWMNKRVFIASIADPYKPKVVSSFFIDGFADGVFVRDGLCLAASGHHSATLKNRRKYQKYPYMTAEMIREGYGCGHGLTLVDVSIPEAPAVLSEIKFPPFFGTVDTWRVTASNGYAYVADTHNGVFAVNIQDPTAPRISAYYRLPPEEGQKEVPPPLQTSRAPAMGVASGNGKLYVAGADTGLHVLDFPDARPTEPCASPRENVPSVEVENIFTCKGQVHSFVQEGDFVILACGNDGLYAMRDSGKEKPAYHVYTEDIAHDVARMNQHLYVAEGTHGISIWIFSAGSGFAQTGRWTHPQYGVRQVVPIPESGLLAAELDQGLIGFLELQTDGTLQLKKTIPSGGILYHRHLCRSIHSSGYMAALPLARGIVWVNTKTLEPAPVSWSPAGEACPFEDGAAIDGDRIWVVHFRKCGFYRNPADTAAVMQSEAMHGVKGAQLQGMPYLVGNQLILLHRIFGTMERLDVSREDAPRLLDRTVLPGHPEFIAPVGETCWIACGHEGLFRILPPEN
ncbi:MAG: hypothetical protein II781_02905 [Clostridia bacterium]|nr:hypothetical protein [Clostridia bacterium]